MNNIKILYYDRTDVSGAMDVNKTSKSKECYICHYFYFLNKGFKFKSNVCNGCQDLLMISINRSDIATLNIKSADYSCCINSGISKSEAINLMQNIDFLKRKQNVIKRKNVLSDVKIYLKNCNNW